MQVYILTSHEHLNRHNRMCATIISFHCASEVNIQELLMSVHSSQFAVSILTHFNGV